MMNLFGFKSKKDEVLNHWVAFIDGFNYPPQQFYAAVEHELEARKVPNLTLSRIEFAEGGVLSEKRIYLRLIRERLAFDTCAAPFGRGYFFSCRSVYAPVVVELWHVLVVCLFFGGIGYLLNKLLDPTFAVIALVGLLLAIAQVFRNTIAMGLSDLDALLIKTPAIGPIYERFFRKDTYFRQDSRLVYLEVVPQLIKELAEQVVASKGVTLISQYENAPVLGELYKPVAPILKPVAA